jgi:hypothetical protein
MRCDEFELIVLALAREQLIDAGTRELGLYHAKICTGCAARLTSERFLVATTRAGVTEIANEEAPAHVEAALLAAFKEHALTAGPSTIMPLPIEPASWFWRASAVAASILILALAMAIFWSFSNSNRDRNQELAVLPVPVELPDPPAPSIKNENVYVPVDATAPVQGHQRGKKRKSNQAELVTKFYPLMDDEDLDSSEVTQVVRVELPASALSAAGMSVSPDMSSVTVKADVALGYDGMARAIRFVH